MAGYNKNTNATPSTRNNLLQCKPATNGRYGIQPTMPSNTAVWTISSTIFKYARKHEQGIIDDTAIEYLHRYRVSLRKLRSLIKTMKQCLPKETRKALNKQLSQLASPTNHLRDLDVFLLNEDHYRELLPNDFEAGVNTLFEHIEKERKKEYRAVSSRLQSESYSADCQAIEQTFHQALDQNAPAKNIKYHQPVLALAKKRLLKLYRAIDAQGSKINEKTPDKEIHQLRIECKQLRYLMEFFAELFPKNAIKNRLLDLKSLQTILGNFNDYSVQIIFLNNHLAYEKDAQVKAAINTLTSILHNKQVNERNNILAAFASFRETSSEDNFETLFRNSH